jgi:muconolactone delta-isomerase
MKYLVLYRENTQLTAATPPPVIIEAVAETRRWLGEVKLSGQATEAMFMSGEHGGLAIFNADSGGQLAELIDACPARPFCSVETIPLMSTDEAAPVIEKAKVRVSEMMHRISELAPAG